MVNISPIVRLQISFLFKVLFFSILLLLSLQHIIFLIKIAMAFVIPDVPEDVRDQMKREKYLDYKVRRIKVMA